MRNYLIIDGVSSINYGVFISGKGTFSSPAKQYEEVSVPGRNGQLLMNTEPTFGNIDVSYDAFAYDDPDKLFPRMDRTKVNDRYRTLSEKLGALRAFLNSRSGYFRLEDSYNTEEFRLAYFKKEFSPNVIDNLHAATFTLTFTCKPQRFLKIGEKAVTFTGTSTLRNTTSFKALPLIRAYGTGTFEVGGTKVQIKSASSYTDIDCELMECYKGTTNCNNNVTLTNGVFPDLKPGQNTIKMTGITKLIITPRWWTI